MLKCEGITMGFGAGNLRREVLGGVALECRRGECCVLLGPSGSGKTTLLAILGCILSPCRGELEIDGQRIDHFDKRQMISVRRKYVGFVFQQSHLLSFLNMEENVRIVARNAGLTAREAESRVGETFDRLGVGHLRSLSPRQVSGGERQRVAIARAIVHRPAIVLADEPTAALDWENGQSVMRYLVDVARQENALLFAVTHDTRLLGFFDRVFYINHGIVTEE